MTFERRDFTLAHIGICTHALVLANAVQAIQLWSSTTALLAQPGLPTLSLRFQTIRTFVAADIVKSAKPNTKHFCA